MKKKSAVLCLTLSLVMVLSLITLQPVNMSAYEVIPVENLCCRPDNAYAEWNECKLAPEYAYMLGLFTEDDKNFIRQFVYYGLEEEAFLFAQEVLKNSSIRTFSDDGYHDLAPFSEAILCWIVGHHLWERSNPPALVGFHPVCATVHGINCRFVHIYRYNCTRFLCNARENFTDQGNLRIGCAR